MSDPFVNLQSQTGKSMPEWHEVVAATGLEKHGEIVSYLKTEQGLTHGFANGIALSFRNRGAPSNDGDLVDAQYAGGKAHLRPIHDRLVEVALSLGSDVEIAVKKTGVSLRRSKQFALIEAASAKRIQLGLQVKGATPTDRLIAWGGMCSHKVNISTVDEVDDEVIAWLRDAYEVN